MNSSEPKAKSTGGCPFGGDAAALLEKGSLTDPRIHASPYDFYTAMRTGDPVHYDEKIQMYLITRYEDLMKVLSDPITFSVKHGYKEQQAKGFEEEYKEILDREGGGYVPDSIGIMTDPPDHTRIRRLMEKAFTAHRMKTLEPGTQEIINSVLDKVIDQGKGDGMHDIGGPFTVSVICDQLGISQFNAHRIREWSEAAVAQIGRMQDRDALVKNAKQTAELQSFLIGHIKQRQEKASEDMISDLVHAELDGGEKLNMKELISLVRTLMVGGNHTTSTAMGNLLCTFATHPEVAEELYANVDDERYVNRFVEELMRFDPPVIGLSRMTTKEVELGGKLLPKGAHLLNLYASGSNDEKEFPCPRDFDVNRPNLGRHLAFGSGVHKCVGLALARMEVRIASKEIVKRITNIKLAVPREELEYIPSVASRTFKSLPITFERRK